MSIPWNLDGSVAALSAKMLLKGNTFFREYYFYNKEGESVRKNEQGKFITL